MQLNKSLPNQKGNPFSDFFQEPLATAARPEIRQPKSETPFSAWISTSATISPRFKARLAKTVNRRISKTNAPSRPLSIGDLAWKCCNPFRLIPHPSAPSLTSLSPPVLPRMPKGNTAQYASECKSLPSGPRQIFALHDFARNRLRCRATIDEIFRQAIFAPQATVTPLADHIFETLFRSADLIPDIRSRYLLVWRAAILCVFVFVYGAAVAWIFKRNFEHALFNGISLKRKTYSFHLHGDIFCETESSSKEGRNA